MQSHIPFAAAARFWFKLGWISFGGPAGQIAIMHEELVEKRRWLSERRFLHALNYCMVLPGPEAQQLAAYIGWLMHKTRGGLLAGAFFVLPSLLILIGLSWIYMAFGDVPVVAGLFYGIKPAVTAIVIQAVYRIGGRALNNYVLCAIAAAAFVAIFLLDVPFPLIVAGAALVGWLGSKRAPDTFKAGGGHPAASGAHMRAVIDDQTPARPHAQFKWARLTAVIVIGLALWSAPMAALTWTYGWQGTLTQMAWFFTKAAFLTFGGAYAVLPYVYQGAVETYGWVKPVQMIDGLALGETTPGPLIMVVTFIGFVGGWQTAALGPDLLVLSAVIAALIVTYFTFLPSFLFILAGGPLVESTHDDVKFTAPLTAITAAVVGVILNLALFFGYHVLWPNGFDGKFEAPAAVLAFLATVLLFKFKWSVMRVIGASALAGLAIRVV